MKNIAYRLALILGLFVHIAGRLYSLEIRKDFEISFDYEVAIFWVDEHLTVWDSRKSEISVFKEKTVIKSIKLNKGQGPGDVQVVNSVFSTPGNNLLWDRFLRRFSFFNKNWEFVKIESFPFLGMACPISDMGNTYLFQWSDLYEDKKGSKINRNIGYIYKDKRNVIFSHTEGYFNYEGKLNYDSPILTASFSDPYLYYARNDEYEIHMTDIRKAKPAATTIIKKKVKPVKWTQCVENLQWEILKKNPNMPKNIYPDFVPPIFSLISCKDMVGIVTNHLICDKKAGIDIYKGARFMGRVEIPILYAQHLVFPPYFYFSDGVLWRNDSLYSLHIDSKDGTFKIMKWNVKY